MRLLASIGTHVTLQRRELLHIVRQQGLEQSQMKKHQKSNSHELLWRLHLQVGFSVWLQRFVH